MLSHVGELESSKSAMNTRAPEFRALIIILRSGGPVISTRRSMRSLGGGATVHVPERISAVSERKSGRRPLSNFSCRMRRFRRRSMRRSRKVRTRSATKAVASGVKISPLLGWSLISMPSKPDIRAPVALLVRLVGRVLTNFWNLSLAGGSESSPRLSKARRISRVLPTLVRNRVTSWRRAP